MSDSTMYQSRKERREAEKKGSLPISNPGSFAEPAMTARTPTIKQPDIFLEPVNDPHRLLIASTAKIDFMRPIVPLLLGDLYALGSGVAIF